MWLGLPVHKHHTNEKSTRLETPSREIIDFKTFHKAFLQVPQTCYPNKRLDVVPINHLHFTQISRQEKIEPTTGLFKVFHIIIRFNYASKSINRQEAMRICLESLRQMDIPLGAIYSNPLDIEFNVVIINWVGFIKVHFENPQQDGLAFLWGNWVFVMVMVDENNKRVLGKINKRYKQITKACNLISHLKGKILRHEHAFSIFETVVCESYYTTS